MLRMEKASRHGVLTVNSLKQSLTDKALEPREVPMALRRETLA
jgi:hypothetical protein